MKLLMTGTLSAKFNDSSDTPYLDFGNIVLQKYTDCLQKRIMDFIFALTGELGYRTSIAQKIRKDFMILLDSKYRKFYINASNLINDIVNNSKKTLRLKLQQIAEIKALVNSYKDIDEHAKSLQKQYQKYILNPQIYKEFQDRKYQKLDRILANIIAKIENKYPQFNDNRKKFAVQTYQTTLNANAKPDAYSFYDAICSAHNIVNNKGKKITTSQQNLIYWLLRNINSERSIVKQKLPSTNLNDISDTTTKYTMISLMNAEVEDSTEWDDFNTSKLGLPIKE